MKCMHCQGKMKKGKAPFNANRNGYHLVLDTVPAWVCSQCGESYFEETAVNFIQKTLQALDQQTEFLYRLKVA